MRGLSGGTLISLVAVSAVAAAIVNTAWRRRNRHSKEALGRQNDVLRGAQETIDELRARLTHESERHAAFVASLTNEVQAPLTILVASTRALVEQQSLDARTREIAESASRNAARVARAVNDLGTAGNRQNLPSHGLIDVGALVFAAAGPHTTVDIEEAAPLYAACDASRLQATLDRLIGQAFRASASIRATDQRIVIQLTRVADQAAGQAAGQSAGQAAGPAASFGMMIAREMLDGTGANVSGDPDRGTIQISLPRVSMHNAQPRPRWSAALSS